MLGVGARADNPYRSADRLLEVLFLIILRPECSAEGARQPMAASGPNRTMPRTSLPPWPSCLRLCDSYIQLAKSPQGMPHFFRQPPPTPKAKARMWRFRSQGAPLQAPRYSIKKIVFSWCPLGLLQTSMPHPLTAIALCASRFSRASVCPRLRSNVKPTAGRTCAA